MLVATRSSERCALVVGATGAIGRRLVQILLANQFRVHITVRGRAPEEMRDTCTPHILDLSKEFTIPRLDERFVVFHLAGNAHAWERGDDFDHGITLEGTERLLRAVHGAGVRHFIYFSSVKASGESGNVTMDELSTDSALTRYGSAKREAERLVLEAGKRYGMHVCNLRLSMVYGVGMKGNLPRMIEAIDRGRFPPLPNANNKRSMVWVDDVVQAALLAADKPEANGQTYIVTDDEAYSTRRIYEAICCALDKPVPRWSVPMAGLKAAAKLGDIIGGLRRRRFPFDSEALDKLLGSAHYSSAKISRDLGYRPTKNLEAVLPEIIATMRAHGLVHR